MKNLKKVIALIAVLALTLSTVALGATYTDVAEDSAYSVAVESLSKLGIVTGYEDGTYGPEKAVTRAEMAALIARIQGYEETASAQTATVFADVPASHWASGYVAAASNMGIVNGYGDGTFGPEDSVKYEQAVTMIMRTLGYEPFAAANGGYPTGYLAAAQRYGLTKNVSNAVSGTDANRGTIAQLLYNGIDTPIMAQSKWGTDGDIEYTIYDGVGRAYKTLMSENLGVVKIKGVVVENAVTDLDDDKDIDTSADEVVDVQILDLYDTTNKDAASWGASEEFLVGDSDIADFLGYRTIFYVMEDEVTDKYVVISAAKDTTTNATVEFTLDQYAGLDTKNAKQYVQYYKNATDKEPADLLVEGATVVYNYVGNGTVSGVFNKGAVVVDSTYGGKVTLIDNNTTNGYDIIFVEVGVSAVVEKTTETKVTFKSRTALGKSIEVDLDDESQIIELTKDGVAIAPADLVEWDVVTAVWNGSETEKYIKAEVVASTVTGTVVSKKSSDTSASTYSEAFKIEGNYYDVANGAYEAADLEIGDGGIFYIDKYGKIVAFNEDPTLVGGTKANYAIIVDVDTDSAFGTDYVQMQLLTANGVDIYDVADDVKVNDQKLTVLANAGTEDASAFEYKASTVKGWFDPAASEAILIKYNTNSSGEIKEIYTLDAEAVAATAATTEFATKGSAFGSTTEYDADNLKIAGAGPIDEDAVLFLIAWDGTSIDDAESKVGTLADLSDGEIYGGQRYADGKADDANVVVITAGVNTVATSSNVAVITEVSEATNEAGEDVLVLSYYQDGKLNTNVETTEKVAEAITLTVGDIVKVKLSGDVISNISMVLNFGDPIRNKTTGAMSASQFKSGTAATELLLFSYAYDYVDKTSSFTPNNDQAYSVRLSAAENIYVIDAAGKNVTIETGDEGDFEYDEDLLTNFNLYADYVFVREFENDVMDVVIVKNIKDYNTSAINNTYLKAAYEAAKATYDAAKLAYNADNANGTKLTDAQTAAADLLTAANDWNNVSANTESAAAVVTATAAKAAADAATTGNNIA